MANGYNTPAPIGYFPPQTNLTVAQPVGVQQGRPALPMNINVRQPSPFYELRPHTEIFGDPTRDLLAPTANGYKSLNALMAAIQQKMPQREAFAGVPFPRPT